MRFKTNLGKNLAGQAEALPEGATENNIINTHHYSIYNDFEIYYSSLITAFQGTGETMHAQTPRLGAFIGGGLTSTVREALSGWPMGQSKYPSSMKASFCTWQQSRACPML